MSGTLHLALCTHIAGLLTAAPAVAGGRVSVQRRRPMAQATSSQVFVYLEEAPAEARSLGSSAEWMTRIRVECVARDTATQSAEIATDAMAADVYSRLMADTTLAGKAIDLNCHVAWTNDDNETTAAAAQVLAIVRHRSPRHSITAT
jgi:hypothetical protein